MYNYIFMMYPISTSSSSYLSNYNILKEKYIGRQKEIQFLLSYITRSNVSCPYIHIYGSTNTGKSSIIKDIMKINNVIHVYLDSNEYSNQALILQSIYQQLYQQIHQRHNNEIEKKHGNHDSDLPKGNHKKHKFTNPPLSSITPSTHNSVDKEKHKDLIPTTSVIQWRKGVIELYHQIVQLFHTSTFTSHHMYHYTSSSSSPPSSTNTSTQPTIIYLIIDHFSSLYENLPSTAGLNLLQQFHSLTDYLLPYNIHLKIITIDQPYHEEMSYDYNRHLPMIPLCFTNYNKSQLSTILYHRVRHTYDHLFSYNDDSIHPESQQKQICELFELFIYQLIDTVYDQCCNLLELQYCIQLLLPYYITVYHRLSDELMNHNDNYGSDQSDPDHVTSKDSAKSHNNTTLQMRLIHEFQPSFTIILNNLYYHDRMIQQLKVYHKNTYTRRHPPTTSSRHQNSMKHYTASSSSSSSSTLLIHHLPTSCKYILLACYLSSFNPPSFNKKLFVNVASQITRKKGGGVRKSRGNHVKPATKRKYMQTMEGPQPFTYHHLVSVYQMICKNENVSFGSTHTQLSDLLSLNLIQYASSSSSSSSSASHTRTDLLDDMKYKCCVTYEEILKIAESVSFTSFHQYIYDPNV